jgi:hypothetical protein
VVEKIAATIEDSFIRLMQDQNGMNEFKQVTDGE